MPLTATWLGRNDIERIADIRMRAFTTPAERDKMVQRTLNDRFDDGDVLMLTQDGVVARRLVGDDGDIEKEYLVRVVWPGHEDARPLPRHFPAAELARLNHGLSLDGQLLRPANVSWQNDDQLRFVLREGRKRQIRRMCELVGLKVVGLKRVRIGRVMLGALPPGQWRYLGAHESFD